MMEKAVSITTKDSTIETPEARAWLDKCEDELSRIFASKEYENLIREISAEMTIYGKSKTGEKFSSGELSLEDFK